MLAVQAALLVQLHVDSSQENISDWLCQGLILLLDDQRSTGGSSHNLWITDLKNKVRIACAVGRTSGKHGLVTSHLQLSPLTFNLEWCENSSQHNTACFVLCFSCDLLMKMYNFHCHCGRNYRTILMYSREIGMHEVLGALPTRASTTSTVITVLILSGIIQHNTRFLRCIYFR